MWRWILGILAFIILALMATCYAGYRRLTSGGNTVAVVVPADSARTFTLLTDRDSLLEWMPAGTTINPVKHGAIGVGDTIRVATPSRGNTPSGRSVGLWIVREVKGRNVVVIEAIEFDPGGLPHTAFTRRDSLVAMNDSTRIVSTFVVAPLLTGSDSAAASGGAVTGTILSTAEKMRLAGARVIWESSLKQLRRHTTN